MMIGAKRIIEIINKGDVNITDEDLKEIKQICERWISIQNNDGLIDGSSIDNMGLKKQVYWGYHLRDGLDITSIYALSTVRKAFLSTMTDEEETIPEKDIIEESRINIDTMTAIRIADEILKNTKKDKIVIYQNNAPLYLEAMDNLHNIIRGQQTVIDGLVERLSQ